jgi:periplasmic divalent cation tolerance protein
MLLLNGLDIWRTNVDGDVGMTDEDNMSEQGTGSERIVFLYTTYPSIAEAEKAGRIIVERRLAACVNILPGMVSHYWWEGAVERGEEVVMIAKTRAVLAEEVRAAIKEMHSYSTPAILVVPIESVDSNYHAWLLQETAASVSR